MSGMMQAGAKNFGGYVSLTVRKESSIQQGPEY